MKKIFVDNKWKIDLYRKKTFIHEQERKRVRKKHLKKRKSEWSWVSPQVVSNKLNRLDWRVDSMYNHEIIECPRIYSFIKNTDDFIQHMESAEKIWKSGKIVDFRLDNVETLTFDALCMLMAFTRNDKIFKKWVRWNFPKKNWIKSFIRKSWFLRKLATKDKKSGWMFNYHSSKKWSSELSEKIVKTVENHTFSWNKLKVRESNIYSFLVEAMQNTDDHAWLWYDWWLSYYKDDDKVTKVCLLDLGAWILRTICSELNISKLFSLPDHSKILQDLFEWTIESAKKRTQTKDKKRWTWLPLIYETLKWPNIQNAYAITNDIKVGISNNTFEQLNRSFHWTFYYFEIKP